jgi:hypothetical protein
MKINRDEKELIARIKDNDFLAQLQLTLLHMLLIIAFAQEKERNGKSCSDILDAASHVFNIASEKYAYYKDILNENKTLHPEIKKIASYSDVSKNQNNTADEASRVQQIFSYKTVTLYGNTRSQNGIKSIDIPFDNKFTEIYLKEIEDKGILSYCATSINELKSDIDSVLYYADCWLKWYIQECEKMNES